MIAFADFELFALGAAAMVDIALLLMLLERNNRRRLVVPLVLVVAGTGLYHGGMFGLALLRDSSAAWAAPLQNALALAATAGLLLMPSAVLHGVLRAVFTGVDYASSKDGRYGYAV